MHLKKTVVLVLSTMVMAGCQSMPEKPGSFWINKHYSELIETLGEPTKIVDGESESTVYIYEYPTVMVLPSHSVLLDRHPQYIPQQRLSYTNWKRFYVNKEGIIYHSIE